MPQESTSSPGYIAQLTLATLFGAGFLPVVPGTWGSAVTVILFWLLPEMTNAVWILILAVIFFGGVKASTSVEKASGQIDPGYIVIDEFVGMGLILVFIPKTFVLYLFAFLLFRIFDIVKPAPIKQLQSLPDGWGVMIDDLVAGLYTLIVLGIGMLIL